MKPYYYVFNPYGSKPSFKHPSQESAMKEAERLAALNPGVKFEILMCMGFSQSKSVNTFWVDGVHEPEALMPF